MKGVLRLTEILKAIILGIVQGLTEFLPVSSSGHLVLMRSLTGWDIKSPATFDVAVHVATLSAVLVVFAPEVVRFLKGLRVLTMREYWKDPAVLPEYLYQSGRLAWLIIIGSIPTGVLGMLGYVLLHDFLAAPDPRIVGLLLIITGSLLFGIRHVSRGSRGLVEMRMSDTVIIGIVQGLAILPGISRSGATISAGLLRGMERKLAGRFSFLLAVPAIVGAGLLKAIELFSTGLSDIVFTLVGMSAAFVSGYVALRLLLKLVEKGRLGGFAYYCWAAGLLAVVLGFVR